LKFDSVKCVALTLLTDLNGIADNLRSEAETSVADWLGISLVLRNVKGYFPNSFLKNSLSFFVSALIIS